MNNDSFFISIQLSEMKVSLRVNWLSKHVENVRSSQPCIWMNFCTESSSFIWVSLKFTVDTFLNCVSHFLDIEICPNGFGIYHENTQTGQYTNIESFTLRKWKTSWITLLTIRAKRICSRNILMKKSIQSNQKFQLTGA